MRFTQILFGARSQIPEKKIKFKPQHTLVLKDRIDGREGSAADNNCLYEMMQLITCLADNNYNNLLCANETKILRKCTEIATQQIRARKSGEDLSPVRGRISIRETNKLLKQYPNV